MTNPCTTCKSTEQGIGLDGLCSQCYISSFHKIPMNKPTPTTTVSYGSFLFDRRLWVTGLLVVIAPIVLFIGIGALSQPTSQPIPQTQAQAEKAEHIDTLTKAIDSVPCKAFLDAPMGFKPCPVKDELIELRRIEQEAK